MTGVIRNAHGTREALPGAMIMRSGPAEPPRSASVPGMSRYGRLGAERIVAAAWALAFTAILAALIVVGSRRLAHFDAALVGYTFASLFATFGITYRYAIWLQRPPTWLYWKRGWQLFLDPRHLLSNLMSWARRLFNAFVINRFIWLRGATR